MLGYIENIKKISKRLLADGAVDMVIGFRRGTLPMMNQPSLATTAQAVDDFVWDSHCGINLANYLTGRKGKIGVVAKGCDTRNIVTHIVENKVERDHVVIIGVPCKGMIDKLKITRRFSENIHDVKEVDGKVLISGPGFEETVAKREVLQENCTVCVHRNPVVYDELAAELVEEQQDVDRFKDVKKIEAMDPQQRWDFFENLFSDCIRCYACKNACPLCYCPTCFVDESHPQWVGKGQDAIDTRTFHFLRAYHCAGRCTDCGSCERACPVGINMRLLTKKLEHDTQAFYGWEAGMSVDERPPMDTFNIDDPETFIK